MGDRLMNSQWVGIEIQFRSHFGAETKNFSVRRFKPFRAHQFPPFEIVRLRPFLA